MFEIEIIRTGNLNRKDANEINSAIDAIETIYSPEDKVNFKFGAVEFTALLSGDISDSWRDIIRLTEELKSNLKEINIQFPSQTFWHFWELKEVENDLWEVTAFWETDRKKTITVSKKIFQIEFQKLVKTIEADLENQKYDKFEFNEYKYISRNSFDKLLAWRIYPKPLGSNYYEHSLKSESDIKILFDYCQINEAIIHAEGWKFLLTNFGVKKLFEIDKTSGWFDTEIKEEWLESILLNALISGINLQSGNFGTYSESNDKFEVENGKFESIDWEEFKSQNL